MSMSNNIPHRFNTEAKIAGKEWLRAFLKRNPDISLRQPTSTSIARAIGFNRPQVERFYINLSALMDKYNFSPQSIYNMDETGLSTVPNKQPKVLSRKGKRSVNKISSAERGTNVTIVNAVSATGNFIPPAFIFGRKRMKAELIDAAPPGSIGMVSDSSFINGDLYLDWLTHFRDHAKPTKDQPILLILDNHVSHCTLKAIEFYRQNNITALTLPPHSSHKMQPLDRGFHGVLKKFYSSECEKWLRNHPGRPITVYQVASIFTPAFHQAATTGRGVELFKCTGIVPWNPDIFTDVDFLASSVTEREDPEDNKDIPSDLQNLPISAVNNSLESMQTSMVSTTQVAERSNNIIEINPPQPGPSCSKPIFLRTSEKSITLASAPEKRSIVVEARSSLQIKSTPLKEIIQFPKSAQMLTIANTTGTNGLTCLPKHGGARDNKFWSPILRLAIETGA
jgi:transposase